MIIRGNNTTMVRQLFRAIVLLLGLVVLALPTQAQTQRKPKGPKPPSYDEVMQRALEEKKSVTNAPTVAPVVKPAAPAAAPVAEVKIAAPQPPIGPRIVPETIPTPKVESVPQPIATSVPPSTPVQSSPATATPVAPAELHAAKVVPTPVAITETAKSSKPQTKGPVFSPLPPDLAPASDLAKSPSPSVGTATAATNAMEALDDKYLLAKGDRLSFRIVEDEEEPRSLAVMDSGELEVPHIGRFAAVNKSCKQLAYALKAELEKEYYFRATVIVAVDSMTRSRGKVYLVGAVRLAGAYEIPSDETFTVSKAILRAGGFTDFADKKNVKITRKAADGVNEDNITVDVSAILEKGRTGADVTLLPDDRIYIPERIIRF